MRRIPVTRSGRKGSLTHAHDFRKFRKMQLSGAGLSREDQEVLLGHRMAYYKPTLEAELGGVLRRQRAPGAP
ncbi:MAG: hypothetical protein JRN11_07050 [Nitrososphaerota archaeon]|nr:hypothetical protein [Nitrososphaerota archaeon]MDG7026486.1 hypothetical protein [Nitrososphaerota archaeon]